MKAITQLNGAMGEGDFTNPRGVLTALRIEDEQCKGWFMELALAPTGLRLRAVRPDGACVMISLADLMALFRAQSPEVFADADTIAKAQGSTEKPPLAGTPDRARAARARLAEGSAGVPPALRGRNDGDAPSANDLSQPEAGAP